MSIREEKVLGIVLELILDTRNGTLEIEKLEKVKITLRGFRKIVL